MTTLMMSEISEQPTVLVRTIDEFLAQDLHPNFGDARRVLLIARGTSANAAMYARHLYSARFGIETQLALPAVATHYSPHLDLSDTIAIAVSQSGETAEILDTTRWAMGCGARAFAVTNVSGSTILDVAGSGFVTPAGIERAVPATKSHTAQAVTLGLLGARLSGTDTVSSIRPLSGLAQRLINERAASQRIAELIQSASGGVIVTGRGYTHGVAHEIALKIEETCLDPVLALSYADLRHGPFAVLDSSRVVIVVVPPNGPLVAGFSALVDDIRATGARIVLVGGTSDIAARADESIAVGIDIDEAWCAPLLAIPGQLIAHDLGGIRGLDVDAPRHLTKIGVTDVVVTI